MPDSETEVFNHPFDEVAAKAEAFVKQGAWVFQKFSCEACKNRLTMGERDVFYTRGKCEKCGHITDLRVTGCNFMLVWPKA